MRLLILSLLIAVFSGANARGQGTALREPPFKLSELLRPTVSFSVEGQPQSNTVSFQEASVRLQIPTYPLLGPPPPSINIGTTYTSISSPDALDLPSELYDHSIGMSWMRPIGERWLLRFMVSGALATDGRNNSSDAWQIRGGAFAIYRPTDRWSWIVGAIAVGRNDLPVVPAVGAIWHPTDKLTIDLTLPKPKFAFMLVDNGSREQWGYLGGGFSGSTWAYEQSSGVNDQLTYRDWRVVVGWENLPKMAPGAPFRRGRKLGVEVGYAFARQIEFESLRSDVPVDATIMLRASASF